MNIIHNFNVFVSLTLQLVRLANHQIKVWVVVNRGTQTSIIVQKLFFGYRSVNRTVFLKIGQKFLENPFFCFLSAYVKWVTSHWINMSTKMDKLQYVMLKKVLVAIYLKSSTVMTPSPVLSNFANAWLTIFFRDSDIFGCKCKKMKY